MSTVSNLKMLDDADIQYLGKPVQLISSRIYKGCNIYHHSTVMRQSIDFGELSTMPLQALGEEFVSAYLERFLGLPSLGSSGSRWPLHKAIPCRMR